MITIKLQSTELLFDIRNKSHQECEAIADIDARYRTEAGSEKTDEVRRCLTEAVSRLDKSLHRWLVKSYAEKTRYDDADIPSEDYELSYVYDFAWTPRQGEGKDKMLADLMHDYVVSATLAKFYAIVSAQDLSNMHSTLALEAGNNIIEMLALKSAPTSTYDTSTL